MGTILDTDYLVVNRNGTDYKTTAADLDLYINPVPTFVTASVGTETSNWSPYIKAEDYDTKVELDIYNDDSIWTYGFNKRNPDIIFSNSSNKSLLATKPSSGLNPEVIFEPPGGINVQQSVTFVAGFHIDSQLGTLSINGVDLLDIEAHDLNPKEFTVPFSGNLERFSIRQKEYTNPPGTMNGAPGIASISLDGKQLLNQAATTLTFEPGEFFDRVKVGTNLEQVNPKVTGVVSKVIPGENKVILDDLYPEFVSGSTIIIVGADPIRSASATRGVPVKNDYLVINRNNTDYKITAKDLKDYIYPVYFVTASVDKETSNWTPYVRVENYDTKEVLDINDDSLWYYSYDKRKPENMFTKAGNTDENNLSLLSSGSKSLVNPEVIFEPAGGIEVTSSVTIVAGFHGSSQLGTLAVNGLDVLEFDAHDLNPKQFTYEMSGTLNSFSIRQKNPAPVGASATYYAPGIAGVMLDGKLLRNQDATTLTFEPGKFFSLLKVGTTLQQVNPEVTGVVSKVIPEENKVILDDLYIGFQSGSTIIIVG